MEQTSEEHVTEKSVVEESNESADIPNKKEDEKTNEDQGNEKQTEPVIIEDENSNPIIIEEEKGQEESTGGESQSKENIVEILETVGHELLHTMSVEESSNKQDISEEIIVEEKKVDINNTKINNDLEENKKDKIDVKDETATTSEQELRKSENVSDEFEKSEVVIEDCIEEEQKETIDDKREIASIQTENVEKQIQNLNISVIPEKCNIQASTEENNEINNRRTENIIENEKENHFYSETPTRAHLQKIFTPAEDALPPKNRKNFASSAFYSPNHPTVEDQVNLARRISHSLSDISNQQSKGQTMYVNRKKRSVKWVHESGEGQSEYFDEKEEVQENIPNNFPLKVLMNPRGKIRDLSSLPNDELISDTGLLSPTKCKELVSALNGTTGKGAELFAKRRKRAEKWAAEGNDVQDSPSYETYNQMQEPLHRYHENQAEIYCQPKHEPSYNTKPQYEAKINNREFLENSYSNSSQAYETKLSYQPNVPIKQRDLAYKPNIAQGWNSRPINLPTELYVPKEIPLESYKAPPKTENFMPKVFNMKPAINNMRNDNQWNQPIEKFPTTNTSYDNNPWIQQTEKLPQAQSYYSGSSQPIRSPWHEMERNAKQQSLQAQTNQYHNLSPQPKVPQYKNMPYQSPVQYPAQQPLQQYKFSKTNIHGQNFNTAARGWNGSKLGHCYKPITFGQQPKSVCMQYTDF